MTEARHEHDDAAPCLVATGRSRHDLALPALVLAAAAIDHEMAPAAAGWGLFVGPEDRGAALAELAAYEEENAAWPPPPVMARHGPVGWSPIVVCLALLWVYSLSGPWDGDGALFRQGAVDGRRILAGGEWWRLVTGLTLHADLSHVLGNVTLGGVILALLAAEIGPGAAVFFTLAAGAMGNAVNVRVHGVSYLGVGFSTAVFGSIGLLCGGRIIARADLRSYLVPVGAGAGLLAMLGTGGGARTDVGAHVWGLAAGCLLGMISARGEYTLGRTRLQWILLALAWFLVLGCWYLAY